MNIWEKKTGYSKRFPKLDIQQMLKEAETVDAGNGEGGLQRVLQRLEKECTRPADPDKVRRSKRMTEIAIAVSQEYEIDADVTEGLWYVNATLYLAGSEYMDDLKDRLAALLALCDHFALLPDPQNEHGVILALTCRTHL